MSVEGMIMSELVQGDLRDRPLEELFCDEVRATLGFARLYQTRFLNLMKGRYGHPRIDTVGELIRHSRHDLRERYYVGPKTYRYVVAVLRQAGYRLKAARRRRKARAA